MQQEKRQWYIKILILSSWCFLQSWINFRYCTFSEIGSTPYQNKILVHTTTDDQPSTTGWFHTLILLPKSAWRTVLKQCVWTPKQIPVIGFMIIIWKGETSSSSNWNKQKQTTYLCVKWKLLNDHIFEWVQKKLHPTPPPPQKNKTWLLLMEKIQHHLGCQKNHCKWCLINYQPQVVSKFGFLVASTVPGDTRWWFQRFFQC